VQVYFQLGVNLISKCETRTMTAAVITDIVALIDRGADVRAKESHGSTPLHMSVYMGHAQIAMMLLEKGVDGHTKDNRVCTPLYNACINGHARSP